MKRNTCAPGTWPRARRARAWRTAGGCPALALDVSRFTKPAAATVLTAEELEACWTDLARDATTAYRAIGRLRAAGAPAVALLRERLKPAPVADAQRIKQLIADLDSEQF